MMRFVDAIHDKEKIKVTDEDILSNFLKANPNYLTNYELSIIKKLLKIDQKYLKIQFNKCLSKQLDKLFDSTEDIMKNDRNN